MERALIFPTLGIDETTDEKAIRAAYMKLLRQTNPEDDPDGFKRLREAYEQALALARQPQDKEAADTPKSDIELWTDQADALYQDITRRWQTEEWKTLLSDPLCEDLDTAFETREALLRYLMDHIYLPQAVLVEIDRVFQIKDDLQLLAEKFPRNFLDYLVYYIDHKEFLNYTAFRILNREHMDADGYIRSYLDIKQQNDRQNFGDGLRRIGELSAFGIWHPYQDVERIRILTAPAEIPEEDAAEAAQISKTLLDQWADDPYILLHCGQERFRAGEKAEAYQLWQKILKDLPDHYMAKLYSARYLLDQKEYQASKDLVLELLDLNGDNDELISMVTTANEALIQEYQAALEDPGSSPEKRQKDTMELCWCLFQNGRLDDTIALMKTIEPQEEDPYPYYSLYSRLLYRAEQYEAALPLLKQWLSLIRQTRDDGTSEKQKRIGREFQACHILSGCCHALKDQEHALAYVEEAISAAKNRRDLLAAMQYKAYLLFTYEQYERSIDACDQVLAEDDQYYPAYQQRQEAAFKLHKGQQVVDDFYSAIRIYAGYFRPYLLAAQVFFYHDQFEDAKGVLDRAVENQVEFSDCMHLYEVKILRNLANSREDREKPLAIANELLEKIKNPDTDIEDRSEVEYEIALLHWDNNDFETALTHLHTAISQNPDRPQYHLICGHIHLDHGEYRRALAEYDLAEDAYGDSPSLHYNRGLCHEALGFTKMAMDCYKETLQHARIHRKACEKLARYYKDRYSKTADPECMKQAKSYLDRQIEEQPTCHDLIERSLLYMDNYDFEEALRDCEEALKYDSEGWSVYNNMGCCYKWQGQYEKAIEYFRQAVEHLDDDDTLPYRNLADCYEALDDFQTAISFQLKVLAKKPDDQYTLKELALLHVYIRDYNKALYYLEKIPDHKDYYSYTGDVYFLMGNLKKALAAYKNGVKKAPADQKADRYSNLAGYYKDQLLDFRKAEYYYQKALAIQTDEDELHELEWELAAICFRMGQREKAKEHAKKSLEHFAKIGYSSEEAYLNYRPYRPARLFRQAWIYICLGETEKGLEMFRQMTTCTRCKSCRHQGCYEAYLFLGYYYEAIGDDKTALDYYRKSLEANSSSISAAVALEHLQKKGIL